MNLEQHLKAAQLLHEIQDKLEELHGALPSRELKNRCRTVQKSLQNRLVNHLRFSHWESAKNPNGSYAFSLHDDPYPAHYYP